MPVLDTDVLFALNPKDNKHGAALKLLSELQKRNKGILVADTTTFEFIAVLRSVNKKAPIIRAAILAIRKIIETVKGEEVNTICSDLLANQCTIEERFGLTFFDSLIAASTLNLDGELVSDDKAFDRISGIRRIPLSQKA